MRPALEVADIFRAHGPAWRHAQAGHLNLAQLKVMSAIEQCRTSVLGGHVLRCNACETTEFSPPRVVKDPAPIELVSYPDFAGAVAKVLIDKLLGTLADDGANLRSTCHAVWFGDIAGHEDTSNNQYSRHTPYSLRFCCISSIRSLFVPAKYFSAQSSISLAP